MKLILLSAGDRRISVIKEIRAFTGLGLKDAKDLSEKRDAILFDGPGRIGHRFHKALLKVGATVEIKHTWNPLPRLLRALADWIEG